MVWPNCLRVAAHCVAISSARCARPTHCAATVRRVAPSQVLATSKPVMLLAQDLATWHAAIGEDQLAMMEAAMATPKRGPSRTSRPGVPLSTRNEVIFFLAPLAVSSTPLAANSTMKSATSA